VSRALLWLFTRLAAAGFAASLLVHVFALAGRDSPLGSAAALLHIGIFAIWIPVVFMCRRPAGDTLHGTPRWVKQGAAAAFAYAIANFVLFIVTIEYKAYPKDAVPEVIMYRGFSGHWMLFYYLGAAALYAEWRRRAPAPELAPFGRST
jgi:hypothetical protein